MVEVSMDNDGRQCPKCLKPRTSDEFSSGSSGRKDTYCKQCRAEYSREYYWRSEERRQKQLAKSRARYTTIREKRKGDLAQWREEHGNHLRHYSLTKNYGISLEEFEGMVAAQQGVCAVCGQPETAQVRGKSRTRPLSVDHNHVTGAVRGLLCGRCNSALGLLQEDESRVEALLEYLKKHRGGA